MNTGNSKESHEDHLAVPTPSRGLLKTIGTTIFFVGLIALKCGAVALFAINSLPSNGGANWRLPSIYVMGVGIVIAIVGLVLRDLRVSGSKNESIEGSQKEIPTRYGMLAIVAILIIFFFVVSKL